MNANDAVDIGRFVAEAYAMYDADPTNLQPKKTPCFPSGYDLVAWITMADFFGDVSDRVFYGIIAASQAAPSAVVVAIRGTQGAIEWWDDLHFGLVPFSQNPAAGEVAEGFDSIYETLRVTPVGRAFDVTFTSGSFAEDSAERSRPSGSPRRRRRRHSSRRDTASARRSSAFMSSTTLRNIPSCGPQSTRSLRPASGMFASSEASTRCS